MRHKNGYVPANDEKDRNLTEENRITKKQIYEKMKKIRDIIGSPVKAKRAERMTDMVLQSEGPKRKWRCFIKKD